MSNVLPFKRVTSSAALARAAAADLHELLITCDQLIMLLRNTDNEGLDVLTDSLVGSVVRCRETMAKGIDETTGPALVKIMRKELHQIPRTLRSLLPGIGPRLGESMERKLGIQFSSYE